MHWQVLIFTVLVLLLPLQDVQSRGAERGTAQERQLKQFRNYEIVTPYRLDGRHRREANTLSQDGHLIEASFLLPAFGKEYILDVRLNENLFPGRYVETEYTEDGELVTRLPHRNHHCYYQGMVRQGNISAVAISTCKGLRGMVHVDGEALRVEPLEGSSGQHHVVYKEEDVISDGQKLLMDVKYSTSESLKKLEELAAKHRHRRDIVTETKYVELVIVNDDKELQLRNNDITEVQQRSKDIANGMDMLYRVLNIRIALVAVEVWRYPQIDITTDAYTNLVKFQDWRREDLLARIPNDNAQLITGQPFKDSIVGMAEHGMMCTEDKSCGISTDIELALARQTVIITHEVGHNLGFHHNTEACTCPDVSCIMDDSLADPPSSMFSSCTKDTLEDVLMKGYGVCLLDYPKSFFGGPVCGNHFLEEGEECDCGTPEECDTKCCVAEVCRFHANATCAAGLCCDENCQMKSGGTLCRDTFNECDLPEYCTGMSAECPGNVYLQNGEKCLGDANARCYNGKCLSYQRQCEDVWGKGTGVRVGIEQCFDLNTQGSHFASCGETDEDPCPIPKQDLDGPCYKACLPQNVKCGRLMCENVPARPVLSGIARIATGEARDARGYQHDCKSASFDFGEDVPDPGYVAEGTLCAEGKICVDFKCQNMSAGGVTSCPYNCHNHGVCNSKNHCHCDQGWAPPLCDEVGYGGSIDSGPASPPDPVGMSHGAMVAILIFFLVIVPIGALVAVLYCKRQRLKQMFQKSKQSNSGSRHGSYVNKRYVSSNGTSSKNIVRTPSIRASPPTIEHIPNTSTGSVVHDIHPLVPTVPEVKYKPVPTQQPSKPSALPPSRPTGPPSRPTGAILRPTAPPTDPAVKALLPKSKPTVRSHSFNLPATIEHQSGKAPLRPAPPLKRPPPVHETKTPENGIASAKAALKPVSRSRPNFNVNNSKDSDWRKGEDRITKDGEMDEEKEESFRVNKPTVLRKPSTPRKPPMLPSRPPLRTQSLRGPSALQQ